MSWTYYARKVLDPERVRSIHRADGPITETWDRGAWRRVPGYSLAHADQDHTVERITEEQARRLTAR